MGKGADVVVDMVGQSHWERNINALAMDGRMTLLATMSGKLRSRTYASSHRAHAE